MIATLEGMVSENIGGTVVLDVRGVGYGLFMTTEDQGRATGGVKVKVYVYEHIREQAYDLFGFLSLDTKQLFEQLLGVNGVGPKMALNILSIGSSNDVRAAIAGGDVKYITTAQGVGKRVGERVVVELKDKVGLAGVELASTGMLQGESMHMQDEAVQALVALGYDSADAARALKDVDPALPVESRIKHALRGAR
jgi:holliday junction DNA helicase RuvA